MVLRELISQLEAQTSCSSPWLTSSACLSQPPWPTCPPTCPVPQPALETVASAVSTGVKDQPEYPL